MKGRERFMVALANEKPDRLPCQVHCWMPYYLKTYLHDIDQFQAYEHVGMDPVIYAAPAYEFAAADLGNWQVTTHDLGIVDRNSSWIETIETPGGTLRYQKARNQFTEWTTEYLIKNEEDFEIWRQYVPLPISVDWHPVIEAKRLIGDRGIVRGGNFDFGQNSPWQSLCYLMDIEKAIFTALDQPDWMRYALDVIFEKKVRIIEISGRSEFDLVETGGGAGSSTVISPALHKTFCLPYDKIQHQLLHEAGTKVVYHLCGGIMPLLDIVVENGADALETMTPRDMGGDCDLAEANRRIGDRMCFIGGFDQNKGFEQGTPQTIGEMVRQLFTACPEGGYICSPSDHFFMGSPENIQAFAQTAGQCIY